MSTLFASRLFRFLISGGVSAVLLFVLLYLFTEVLGIWYLVSATAGFITGTITNFTLQKFWAFKEHNVRRTPTQLFFFVLLGVGNIVLNALFLYLLVDGLGMWYMFAQGISLALLAGSNFILYGLIFKKEKGAKGLAVLIATGLYPPDIGGPATYSALLEKALPARGIAVDVFSFGKVRQLPVGIRHFVYAFNLLLRAERADIIYAQDPVSVGFPAWLVSAILWKKFILKVVGDYAWEQYFQSSVGGLKSSVMLEEFQGKKFGWKTELRRLVEHFVARRAERVVVPSQYLKGIVKQWGVADEKIKVIYNAFEPIEIKESKETLRKELGLEGTVLISVGRLVPWKGFDTLIELMPEICREVPDAKLYIVGDGPQRGNLELRIKNYELRETVILTGKLKHGMLLKYLKAADLFVLNTGYEGFSHLLLEVMAVGTPIITTNVGGNPELIESGKTGALVEYNNKTELKDTILMFLRTLEYRGIVKNAQEKVKEFSKEKMMNKLGVLLQSL